MLCIYNSIYVNLINKSDKILTSFDLVVPSSSKGCRVFNGRLGESSASPTSSKTTTDTQFWPFFFSWNSLALLNTSKMVSEVECSLHW